MRPQNVAAKLYNKINSTDIDNKYESVGFGIRFVERIPLSSIQSTKPVNSDLVDSYVIVQHFCDEQ